MAQSRQEHNVLLVGDHRSGIAELKRLLEGEVSKRLGVQLKVRDDPIDGKALKKEKDVDVVIYVAVNTSDESVKTVAGILKMRDRKKLAPGRELLLCDRDPDCTDQLAVANAVRAAAKDDIEFLDANLKDEREAASQLEKMVLKMLQRKKK